MSGKKIKKYKNFRKKLNLSVILAQKVKFRGEKRRKGGGQKSKKMHEIAVLRSILAIFSNYKFYF